MRYSPHRDGWQITLSQDELETILGWLDYGFGVHGTDSPEGRLVYVMRHMSKDPYFEVERPWLDKEWQLRWPAYETAVWTPRHHERTYVPVSDVTVPMAALGWWMADHMREHRRIA